MLFWVITLRVTVISYQEEEITITRCVITQRSAVLCNHYSVKFSHGTASDLHVGESFRISCSWEDNIKMYLKELEQNGFG